MWRIAMLFCALLSLGGCASAVPDNQPDGRDCNYAAQAHACGDALFCDPGERTPQGAYARTRVYGFLGDKTHVVGTCRPKAASGAPCQSVVGCLSGRCVRPAPDAPAHCE